MKLKNRIIICTAAVLALASAVFCGYKFCTEIEIKDGGMLTLIPAYLAFLIIGCVASELVHEGAHLLVGTACSMGVSMPKIRFFKSSSVEIYPKGDKNMRLRFVLTAAAGLFFNFIFIAVGVVSLFVEAVPVVLAVGIPYSLFVFIVNAAPVEYSGGKTDGLVCLEVISGAPTGKVLINVLKIQGLVHKGEKLENVDESLLFDLPQIAEDDVNFLILTQVRMEYYKARGDAEKEKFYRERYEGLAEYFPWIKQQDKK